MIDHGYDKLEHDNEVARNTFVVNWCMTDKCNFKCSYCLDVLHSGKIGWPDYETVLSFCTYIINLHKNKNIYFDLTGGEITGWEYLPMLINILKSYPNISVGILSNGSKSLKWWDSIKDLLDHICLSFHPEFSNRSHYIKLLKLLATHMRTHANLMLHPDHFELCQDIAEEICMDIPNVSLALQPLLVNFGDTLYKYTKNQHKVIEKQFELYGSKIKWTQKRDVYRGAMRMIKDDNNYKVTPVHYFINDKTNNWNGWKCYAGVEQIVIDVNGYFWRGWCKEGGSLGHISTGIAENIEPIICNRNYCHCNFDIMCTKERV